MAYTESAASRVATCWGGRTAFSCLHFVVSVLKRAPSSRCAEKWITTQKSCPQCKVKCNIKDLRNLFVNKIFAMDSIERNQLKDALAAEQIRRAKAEQIASNTQSQLRAVEMQMAVLKSDHAILQESQAKVATSIFAFCDHPALQNAQKLRKCLPSREMTMPLSKSRVLAYSSADGWLLASTQLANSRFGIRRFSVASLNGYTDELDIGHTEAIRDIKLSPVDPKIALTASTDRSIRLTNLASKNCVLAIEQQSAAFWGCCWDTVRPNYCYCGTQTGAVFVFGA